MTTLALKSFSLVRDGLVIGLTSWVLGHMNAFGKAIQTARQVEANYILAQKIIHEYPDHTVHSLAHKLNVETLKEVYDV